MASTPSTCSPSSLQLRLALNCKNCGQFPSVLVRARVRKLDPRFRVIFHPIVHNGAKIERANGLRRSGVCFAGSNSKADGFSGWSESDSEEEALDLQRKKWFGGTYCTFQIFLMNFIGGLFGFWIEGENENLNILWSS